MNTLGAMVSLIKAQTGVAALVSTRVYGGQIPADVMANLPCVMVRRAGGESNPNAPLSDEVFNVWCYGATRVAADGVYAALRDALHGNDGGIGGSYRWLSLRQESGPFDLREPVTDSEQIDSVFSTWRGALATDQ